MQADPDRPLASIRLAHAEDAAGIARVHVESWRDAYASVLPKRHLLQLDPQRYCIGWTKSLARADDRHHTLVAIADNEIVGFATFGKPREGRPASVGEIYMLYVATDWREQGVGRQLLQAAFVALWETGSKAASIWCLEANHAAIGFYKRLDGKRLGVPRQERVGGIDFPVIGFNWTLFN